MTLQAKRSSALSHIVAVGLAIGLFAGACFASEPVVDGDFSEWEHGHIAAVDAAGDAEGAFDITRVWIMSNGSIVHVRFDVGRTLNLQSGLDAEGTLRFSFLCERTGGQVVVDTRNREVSLTDPDGNTKRTNWHETGYWSAPTYASTEFEFRIDLSSIGAELADEIRLSIDGSDALDEPIVFHLEDEITSPRTAGFTLPEPAGNQLRVVSLNTLRNGMVDAERAPTLIRLLKSQNPDIILLQEEYNTSAQDIETAIETALGGDWNTVKTRDNVIVSPLPLTKLTSFSEAYAAAIIEPEGQSPRLVLSVHPKCCGHIGSDEDRRRIEETRAMIRTIELARQRYGQDIPVLVAGDWNLVGSRTPLDLLTNPTTAALRHIEARNPATGDTYTWISPRSDFGPGLLDLVTMSAPEAERSSAAVLDTQTLSPAILQSLGLQKSDSGASDHLMLVFNF